MSAEGDAERAASRFAKGGIKDSFYIHKKHLKKNDHAKQPSHHQVDPSPDHRKKLRAVDSIVFTKKKMAKLKAEQDAEEAAEEAAGSGDGSNGDGNGNGAAAAGSAATAEPTRPSTISFAAGTNFTTPGGSKPVLVWNV